MNNYIDAISWSDCVECDYLQQGNRDDVSSYSFKELMFELLEQ